MPLTMSGSTLVSVGVPRKSGPVPMGPSRVLALVVLTAGIVAAGATAGPWWFLFGCTIFALLFFGDDSTAG
ncbi:hypothetical protein LWP59_13990 [Amycolatopsis acidiphila]|uniref:Uncharacterized protein n=1 Tax=Amycolatopsis acidiphila TaxID=715473 RepID=A0A558AKA4_9PSEU|nr:hypothetical protein [Amycolatopsis acidiphila]TVT24694.1 hypothetical protein FNH06_04685 [Amycolatopsis acidiphila]UIJ62658.1 hypothetical protein LWP59_13990 [Amycolatopsis acidiphila]